MVKWYNAIANKALIKKELLRNNVLINNINELTSCKS